MTTSPVKLDPERDAMINRAFTVWAMFCDIWLLDNLNATQRVGVMNMLFEMQRREQEYWKIELPPYDPEKT